MPDVSKREIALEKLFGCNLPQATVSVHSFLVMDEKIKIRYNYLFEYNKGPKRVLFKKQGSSSSLS